MCELKLWNTLSDAPKQRPRITLLKKWLKNMIFVKHKDVCISLYISVNMYNYRHVSGVLKPNANCKLVFMIWWGIHRKKKWKGTWLIKLMLLLTSFWMLLLLCLSSLASLLLFNCLFVLFSLFVLLFLHVQNTIRRNFEDLIENNQHVCIHVKLQHKCRNGNDI